MVTHGRQTFQRNQQSLPKHQQITAIPHEIDENDDNTTGDNGVLYLITNFINHHVLRSFNGDKIMINLPTAIRVPTAVTK